MELWRFLDPCPVLLTKADPCSLAKPPLPYHSSSQLFLLPSPRAQGLNYMDGQERGWLAASSQTRCSWRTCPVSARWSAGKEAPWRADGRHCWQCLWVRRKWRRGLWFQLCCLVKLNCYTLWDSCLSDSVNVSQLPSSTSCVWAAVSMVRILHMYEMVKGEQLRKDQILADPSGLWKTNKSSLLSCWTC